MGGGWAALMMAAAAAAAMALLPLAAEARNFRGIPGDFCRNRKPSQCCEDRFDDCSVPILGTFCYCDEFCLNKDPEVDLHDDCCPDFREVCLGEEPQIYRYPSDDPDSYTFTSCERSGVRVQHGESHTFNCNECTCKAGELQCEKDKCLVEEAVVRQINSHPRIFGWKAANYSQFWGRKAKEGLLLRTGTFYPDELSMNMHPMILRPDMSLIPEHFDSRRVPKWQGFVSDVRDQGWCGASWVFSTLGVTQDRLSILTEGVVTVELSLQDLLSCAKLRQENCKGGHIERAWQHLRKIGVVKEECYRYESGQSGKVPPCRLKGNSTYGLTCQEKHQYRMEPAYRISSKEEDIQWEILTNGPVQAMMKIHKDFFLYKTGVYTHTGLTGAETATHSVRIVGWGVARMPGAAPVKYWLVANSWGVEWGERGYFKIRRGTNEAGIESFILASRGRVANYKYGKTSA